MTALTKEGKPRQRVSPGAPLSERILLHTDRSGACWIWTAAVDRNGYGRVQLDGRLKYAHRISYIAFVGPVPEGKQLDHLCRNRACCNPQHLEPVTAQVNNLRGQAPGARARRRDFCKFGIHSYAEFGRFDKVGRRYCGECQRIYSALRRQVPYAELMRRKRAEELVVDLGAYYDEQYGKRAA